MCSNGRARKLVLVRDRDRQRCGQCAERAGKAGMATERSGKEAERRIAGVSAWRPDAAREGRGQLLPRPLACPAPKRCVFYASCPLSNFALRGFGTTGERVLEAAACLLGKFQATIGVACSERRGTWCGCSKRTERATRCFKWNEDSKSKS